MDRSRRVCVMETRRQRKATRWIDYIGFLVVAALYGLLFGTVIAELLY